MIIGLRRTASKNKIRKSNKFLAQYSKEKKEGALFLKEKQLKAVILRLLSFYKP